jgi:hypothetical protein
MKLTPHVTLPLSVCLSVCLSVRVVVQVFMTIVKRYEKDDEIVAGGEAGGPDAKKRN